MGKQDPQTPDDGKHCQDLKYDNGYQEAGNVHDCLSSSGGASAHVVCANCTRRAVGSLASGLSSQPEVIRRLQSGGSSCPRQSRQAGTQIPMALMTSGIGTATPGQRIAAKQPTRFSGGTRSSIRLRNRSSIQSGTNRPTGIQIPTDRAASGIGMGKGGLRDAAQEPSERHHRAPRGHSHPADQMRSPSVAPS